MSSHKNGSSYSLQVWKLSHRLMASILSRYFWQCPKQREFLRVMLPWRKRMPSVYDLTCSSLNSNCRSYVVGTRWTLHAPLTWLYFSGIYASHGIAVSTDIFQSSSAGFSGPHENTVTFFRPWFFFNTPHKKVLRTLLHGMLEKGRGYRDFMRSGDSIRYWSPFYHDDGNSVAALIAWLYPEYITYLLQR